MNIFFYHTVAEICARMYCLTHVNKMIVEYCQLLCTVLCLNEHGGGVEVTRKIWNTKTRKYDDKVRLVPELLENEKEEWEDKIKKLEAGWREEQPISYFFCSAFNERHPCTISIARSKHLYNWVAHLADAMCKIYEKAFKKIHKSSYLVSYLLRRGLNQSYLDIKQRKKTGSDYKIKVRVKDKIYTKFYFEYVAYKLVEPIQLTTLKYGKTEGTCEVALVTTVDNPIKNYTGLFDTHEGELEGYGFRIIVKKNSLLETFIDNIDVVESYRANFNISKNQLGEYTNKDNIEVNEVPKWYKPLKTIEVFNKGGKSVLTKNYALDTAWDNEDNWVDGNPPQNVTFLRHNITKARYTKRRDEKSMESIRNYPDTTKEEEIAILPLIYDGKIIPRKTKNHNSKSNNPSQNLGEGEEENKTTGYFPRPMTVKEALALAGVSTPKGFAFVKTDNRNTAETNLKKLSAAVKKTNDDSNITFDDDGEMIKEDYFTKFSGILKQAEKKYKESKEYYTNDNLGVGVPAASLFFPDEYRRFKRIDHPRPMTIVTAQSHTAIPAGILKITDGGDIKLLTEKEAIRFCTDFEKSKEKSPYGKGVQFAKLLAENRYFFACTKDMKDPTFSHNLLNVMGGFPLGVSNPDSEEWEWSQLKDCIGDAIPPSFMVQLFLDKSKYSTGVEPSDTLKVLWLACLRYNKAQEDLMSTVLDRYKVFTKLPILVDDMNNPMGAKANKARFVKVKNKEEGYGLGDNKFFMYTDPWGQTRKYGYLKSNTITQYNARLGQLMRNCYDSGEDFLMWDFEENNYGFGTDDNNSTRSAYNKWRDYVINLWIDKSVLESDKINLYSDLLWAGRRVENGKENKIILSILRKLKQKGLYGIGKIENHEYYMTISQIMTQLKDHYKNKNASPFPPPETSDDSSVTADLQLALTLDPASSVPSDNSLVQVQDDENLAVLPLVEEDADALANEKLADAPADEDEKLADAPADEDEKLADAPANEDEKLADAQANEDEKLADAQAEEQSSSDSESSSGDSDDDNLDMFFVVQYAKSVRDDVGDTEHYYQTSTFDVSVLENKKIDDWERLGSDVQIEEKLDTMPSPPAPNGSMYIVVRRQEGNWTMNELKRKRSKYAEFGDMWDGVSAALNPERDTAAPKRIRVDPRNLNLKNAPEEEVEICISFRGKIMDPFKSEEKIRSLWNTYSKKSNFIAKENPFK